jgi:acetyl/propionyl-CoA carboxylase alpha subunit
MRLSRRRYLGCTGVYLALSFSKSELARLIALADQREIVAPRPQRVVASLDVQGHHQVIVFWTVMQSSRYRGKKGGCLSLSSILVFFFNPRT